MLTWNKKGVVLMLVLGAIAFTHAEDMDDYQNEGIDPNVLPSPDMPLMPELLPMPGEGNEDVNPGITENGNPDDEYDDQGYSHRI